MENEFKIYGKIGKTKLNKNVFLFNYPLQIKKLEPY